MTKIYLLVASLITQITLSFGAPEVQLPNGLIRGRDVTTYTDKPYHAFEKIPFAAPPVGDLRFKAPVAPSNWDQPLDTLFLDVICHQVGSDSEYESEDCLYLTVLTPQLPDDTNNASLPVMLWFYGGGFVNGGAMGTYSDRIIDEGVILVAANYRVGVFGFISTQDEVIPGNSGLKDQHFAIKWTHENIHLFGGDPDQITIFGQSAGSASCAYQLLNQANQGLIRSAILESGSFLSPWAFQRNSKEIAFGTASLLNDTFQTNRDSNALLEYLQSVDAKGLDAAAAQYSSANVHLENMEIVQGFVYAPVIEVKNPDAFITKKMYGLLQAGNVVAVPILIGMTSEEAIAYNQNINDVTYNAGAYDQNLNWLVPNDMGITDEATKTEMGAKIREIYTGGEPLLDHLGDTIRFLTDTSFSRSVIKHAELFSQFATTYFYQFSYDGELNHYSTQYDGAGHVGHSQEVPYILCAGTSCNLSNATDQLTAQRLGKIWTNFAKYQNPTPEPSELLQGITWPTVSTDAGDFYYVDIDRDLEVRNHPKEETYESWVQLYDSLGYSDFDTY